MKTNKAEGYMLNTRSKISLRLVDILDQPIKNLKVEIRTAARVPEFDSSRLQIAQQSNEIKDLAVVLAEYCNGAILPN